MLPREKIDIEHLVTRAYREKAVHRLRNVGTIALGLTGPKAPGAVFSSDDKVDTSSFSARAAAATRELQARLAAAPDVLLDLHDAVLGLPNFYIERGAGLDFVVWDEETAARDGHRIEVDAGKGAAILKVRRRGGRGPGRDDLLPDGDPRRLTALVTSAIIVLAGQYGDRPHVSDVVIERYRPLYVGNDKCAAGREPVYETPLHAVVESRASYAVWHAALGMLAARFADHAEVEATGPAAPGEPWAAPVRILQGEFVHEWLPDEAAAAAPKAKRKRPYVPRKTKENPTVAIA